MSKLLRLTLVTCLFVAASALTTFAQSTVTGGIGGAVIDPNGAVVPNASVTSRNIETNKEDTATTDHEGRYRIVNLQPGTYTRRGDRRSAGHQYEPAGFLEQR